MKINLKSINNNFNSFVRGNVLRYKQYNFDLTNLIFFFKFQSYLTKKILAKSGKDFV